MRSSTLGLANKKTLYLLQHMMWHL